MAFEDLAAFCLSNPLYFDDPAQIDDELSHFPAGTRAAPYGWEKQHNGLWVGMHRRDARLPTQGWKLHVSARPEHASTAVELVYAYCIQNNVHFKFLRSRLAVLITNSKYWNRSSSGKVITVYPSDDAAFTRIAFDLDLLLHDIAGPYVLSDARLGNGPVYFRYGAFIQRWSSSEDGTPYLSISTPDGATIPDRRDPWFSYPDFVTPPTSIAPFLNRAPTDMSTFPYTFTGVLHYSNGGGIYSGTTDDGHKVVLREARPLAGLDAAETDAVTRLALEYEILTRLKDLSCTPNAYERLTLWEHHFLVEEHIDGRSLLDEIIFRHPSVSLAASDATLAIYIDWVSSTFDHLKSALLDIHNHGVAIGDLHPSNIIVRPTGEIVYIDFECATSIDSPLPNTLHAPGFAAPAGTSIIARDNYALTCVLLMMLMPIVSVASLDRRKYRSVINAACNLLPVPSGLRNTLFSVLVDRSDTAPGSDALETLFAASGSSWPPLKKSIIDNILSSATPQRIDRLFPGDPFQFSGGRNSLAYGASGVLLALSLAGEPVPTQLVDWLTVSSRDSTEDRCGLYAGVHGVAYTLSTLGDMDGAIRLLTRCERYDFVRNGGLFSGQSGVALTLLYFAQTSGRDVLFNRAISIGDRLVDLLRNEPVDPLTIRPGLMHGTSGPALLFIRLFEQTGTESYLDAAEAALRIDLARGHTLDDGTFQLIDGTRQLIYLDGGSAGVGLVLANYVKHRDVSDLVQLLAKIKRGCGIPFVLQPGLFQGRAGLIAALSRMSSSEGDRIAVAEQVRRLEWHAVETRAGVSFPGRGLLKLSEDLATGSAGILMALQSVFEGDSASLPFV